MAMFVYTEKEEEGEEEEEEEDDEDFRNDVLRLFIRMDQFSRYGGGIDVLFFIIWLSYSHTDFKTYKLLKIK